MRCDVFGPFSQWVFVATAQECGWIHVHASAYSITAPFNDKATAKKGLRKRFISSFLQPLFGKDAQCRATSISVSGMLSQRSSSSFEWKLRPLHVTSHRPPNRSLTHTLWSDFELKFLPKAIAFKPRLEDPSVHEEVDPTCRFQSAQAPWKVPQTHKDWGKLLNLEFPGTTNKDGSDFELWLEKRRTCENDEKALLTKDVQAYTDWHSWL